MPWPAACRTEKGKRRMQYDPQQHQPHKPCLGCGTAWGRGWHRACPRGRGRRSGCSLRVCHGGMRREGFSVSQLLY